MNYTVVLCALLAFALVQAVRVDVQEPVYNYRYQEEMKTAASEIPYHSYGGYEGGYYPGGYVGGYRGGFGGIGGKYLGGQLGGGYYSGAGGIGAGGLGAGRIGAGGFGAGGFGAGGIGAGGLGVGGIGAGGLGVGGIGAGGIGAGGLGAGGLGVGGIGAGGLGVGGIGAGGIGAGGIGAGGIAAGGLGAGGIGIGGAGVGGAAFYPHGGIGGGFVDKKIYSGENKNLNGESFEKAHGNKGEEGQHGSQGFSEGQVAVKDLKGDSGYYNDQQGGKKIFDDGKSYHGGQHFNEAGGAGQGNNQKENHKNGHVKKGFKTTHHKDESGSEETFYDEAHDEGDKFHYSGNQGAFGNNGQSNYKGGHENGQFAADQRSKQGQYDRKHIVDNTNADKGQYGQKGYHGSGESFSINNGIGQQSLLGRQEANRLYVNNHPHGYIPFYPGY